MSRKNEINPVWALIAVAGVALLGIFLINSICVYRHYDKKYDFAEATARVTDTWNFVRYMPAAIALGVPAFFTLATFPYQGLALHGNMAILILHACLSLLLIAAVAVFPYLMLSARLATTQAGMLIYRQRGYFVIPTDWNKNTFVENVFHLELVKAMFTMERLELAEVQKITRDGGKTAFVHGEFGTRRIVWRDKQKRDECIAALERACGKRLGSFM